MARPRQISDEQILETARKVFFDQGPGAPTTVIADELGVSQAALFKRFGTKDELLLAAMHQPNPRWIELVERGPDDRDLREQLVEIARALNKFYEQHVPAMATLRSTGMDLKQIRACQDSAPLVRAQRSMARWLRQAREQGRLRETVDADAMAVTLLGALQARAFMNYMAGSQLPLGDPEATIASLVALLWDGSSPENAS